MIANAQPSLAPAEVEKIARERTIELERRTPRLVTWQDFAWPIHCTDYCIYEKEAGKADFELLAADRDAKAYFAAHLVDADQTDVDDVWNAIRDGSPIDTSESFSTAAYLFSCASCGEYLVLWDCD